VARWLPTSLALATLCLGCATPIGVERVDARRVHRHLTGSVLSTGEPSNASTKVLFRTGHRELFEDSPERALAALRSELGAPADPDHLFALAELSFFHGEREHDRSHLLAAALYAYAFLFPEDGASPDAFDPRLRVAADLYNRALTLGLARGDAVAIEDGVHALPFGELSIEVDESLLQWPSSRCGASSRVTAKPVSERRSPPPWTATPPWREHSVGSRPKCGCPRPPSFASSDLDMP
jgi:hypothetical protein